MNAAALFERAADSFRSRAIIAHQFAIVPSRAITASRPAFHQDLKATTVYVTHDQLEAVTMADKMAVMNGGRLQQYDRPDAVFDSPINTFVASFVGSPAMNLVPAELVTSAASTALRGAEGWQVDFSPANARKALGATSASVTIGARHSTIRLEKQPITGGLPGRVYTVKPTGDVTFVYVRLGAVTVVVSVPPEVKLMADEPIWMLFDQDRLHLFDGDSGNVLAPA